MSVKVASSAALAASEPAIAPVVTLEMTPVFANWFAHVGEPFSDGERAMIESMLNRSLGRVSDEPTPAPLGGTSTAPSIQLEVLRGPALSRILLTEEHDSVWWDAEEGEREQLWDKAADAHTEHEIVERLAALSSLRSELRQVARRLDAIALDGSVATTASDAAMLTLNQHALAEMAGARDDHWFRIKLALFESGRWPLGIRAGTFYVV